MRSIDIPACEVNAVDELLYGLVKKNPYIRATNNAGIKI
jgi:hypothetical protein